MTDAEKIIIDLIETNSHLSDELKKKYILALFLMDSKDQEEFLKLFQAFNYRCNSAERGIFIVKPDEKEKVMRSLDEVKKDIISKIQTNNA